MLARFYRTSHEVDVNEHKLGKLVINDCGKELMDLAVITALVVQENSEEGRLAVKCLKQSFLTSVGPYG